MQKEGHPTIATEEHYKQNTQNVIQKARFLIEYTKINLPRII